MRYEMQFVDLQEQHAAVVRAHVTVDEMPEFLGGAFSEVINVLDEQGLHPTGAPFGRYSMPEGGAFDAEVGFPCNDVVKPEGRVEACELPGGRAARTMHVGPYGDVGAAYEAAIGWLTDEGYVVEGLPWECYLDGPEVAEPRTEVFIPCTHAHPVHG
ncbi:MAG TPA: GyrI-like domain-containing protein [Nocardioidaceae bacterium]|nr:GyrI-like domain-containing protein [Nocardioidaceae bacterium]